LLFEQRKCQLRSDPLQSSISAHVLSAGDGISHRLVTEFFGAATMAAFMDSGSIVHMGALNNELEVDFWLTIVDRARYENSDESESLYLFSFFWHPRFT